MNSYQKLTNSVQKVKSTLCIGLDTVLDKIPKHLQQKGIEGIIEFNKQVIYASSDLAAAYKINFAFYEQYGSDGIDAIKQTVNFISNNTHVIADAKRGDIGNTSEAYAKSVFENMPFDSITVSPYMGLDSLEPFFSYDMKMVFVLALTSNPGSADFERLSSNGKQLWEIVIEKCKAKFSHEQLGFVVGATHTNDLVNARNLAGDCPLLIPGVGTQGGSAEETMKANSGKPALVNVSRALIYAGGDDEDFALIVRNKAKEYNQLLAV